MRLRKKSMNLNFTQFHVIYLRANLHLLSTIMYSTFLLPPVNSTRVRQFNFSFHSPHDVCLSILQILIEKNLFSLSMEMQATSRNANVRCWHPQEFFKTFPNSNFEWECSGHLPENSFHQIFQNMFRFPPNTLIQCVLQVECIFQCFCCCWERSEMGFPIGANDT